MLRSKNTLPFVIWLLLLLLSGWWVAVKTTVSSDLALFMPKAASPQEHLLLNELREGPAARLILLAIEGGEPAERARASSHLTQSLRGSPLFARVENGTVSQTDDSHKALFKYRYLLSSKISAESFSVDGLKQTLQQRLGELGSPLSLFQRQLLPSDPTGEFLQLIQSWRGEGQRKRSHGVWSSPDGDRALLIAETSGAGFDLEAQHRAVQEIKASFDKVEHGENLKLRMSGPAVFAVSSKNMIRTETQTLTIAASLLVALILLAAYRSFRLLLLSAMPMGMAILAATAVVSALFGGIHGITLAFGITLLGVTIDYPIHLFSHLNGSERVAESLRRIWPTLRLGVVTTSAGFLVLASTDFSGLTQIGVFAVVGLLSAALFTRYVLPGLMREPVQREPAPFSPPVFLLNPHSAIKMLALLLGLAGIPALISHAPNMWQNDLAALSPIPAELLQQDREMRANLQAPEVSHLVVIRAEDAQSALQKGEALEPELADLVKSGAINGYDFAGHYLPSQQKQKQRQSLLPSAERLQKNLSEARQGFPFKGELFKPFLVDVEQARTSPLLDLNDIADTPLGLRLASLLFQSNDGRWTMLIPLSGVQSAETLQQWSKGLNDEQGRYLNLKEESNRLIARFRDQALTQLALGSVVIVVILWLGLRSPGRVLSVLLPVVLAITLDLGLLLWQGERLSLFHLVSVLLVMGIGIDYALFFNRREAVSAYHGQTFHALGICAVSTVTVFGILSWSEIPVLEAIGKTVAMGVAACFFLSMALAQNKEKNN